MDFTLPGRGFGAKNPAGQLVTTALRSSFQLDAVSGQAFRSHPVAVSGELLRTLALDSDQVPRMVEFDCSKALEQVLHEPQPIWRPQNDAAARRPRLLNI